MGLLVHKHSTCAARAVALGTGASKIRTVICSDTSVAKFLESMAIPTSEERWNKKVALTACRRDLPWS